MAQSKVLSEDGKGGSFVRLLAPQVKRLRWLGRVGDYLLNCHYIVILEAKLVKKECWLVDLNNILE